MREENSSSARQKLRQVICTSDTRAGRSFDIILLGLILLSVVVVMLESVESFRGTHSSGFLIIEWGFTIIFTIEYALRLWVEPNRWRFVTSFFGVIDLLSILPAYLSLLLPGSQILLNIRILRLIRIFRILKLGRYIREGRSLAQALHRSRFKITVFLVSIIMLVVLLGTLMYLVEGKANEDLDSIPRAVYWAIITMTTVGYGDIAPVTAIGQFLASIVMIMGYSILAVPTGIVSAEIAKSQEIGSGQGICPDCGTCRHSPGANFCHHCGCSLPEEPEKRA